MVFCPQRTVVKVKALSLVLLLLLAYAANVAYLARYLEQRPVAIKLGYTPSAGAYKLVCGDQRYAIAEWNVLRVIFYFGSLIEKGQNNIRIPPEYYNMFKTIETAIELDPYNMDAYYFAQASFTWEVGHAQDVNRLLDYGMRFRVWDYYLPYFAGFNAAYFLKKPKEAATYFKKAAELSGNPLFANLAARYLQETDQTKIAISFLTMMIEKATDKNEKALYTTRLEALMATQQIVDAIAQFDKKYDHKPMTLQELVTANLLPKIPADPYGGTFYLDDKGKVQTTSKFAPINAAQESIPLTKP